MKALGQFLGYVAVRGFFGALAILPQEARIGFFRTLFVLATKVVPRLRRISIRNLELAFPEKDDAWRREIFSRNLTEMSRLLADTVRMPSLDEAWVRTHVRCDFLPEYVDRLKKMDGKGWLIATGHLGSFELLGHTIGVLGYPLSAIARKFRNPMLDRWWTKLREGSGNTIIDRRGAFKAMVSHVSKGRSVAVLFDQNVTRNYAVFPLWFGVPAATTRALALAAIKTEAPVVVASIRYSGSDNYSIEACECQTEDIYRDTVMPMDDKVLLLTQRLSDHYCRMIVEFPEGWFWLHRRWATQSDENAPSVYR